MSKAECLYYDLFIEIENSTASLVTAASPAHSTLMTAPSTPTMSLRGSESRASTPTLF